MTQQQICFTFYLKPQSKIKLKMYFLFTSISPSFLPITQTGKNRRKKEVLNSKRQKKKQEKSVKVLNTEEKDLLQISIGMRVWHCICRLGEYEKVTCDEVYNTAKLHKEIGIQAEVQGRERKKMHI